MDREIKFRLIENGKIVGYETHELDTPCGTINIYHNDMNIEAVEGAYISHDSKEWYTGLKDKNSVDLDWWEGDVFDHTSGKGIIEWFNGGLYMHDSSGFTPVGEAVEWAVLPRKTGTIHDKEQQ